MKYIENYFIKNYKYNIISLVFKTKHKWCAYDDLTECVYIISSVDIDKMDYNEYKSSIVEVPPFLNPSINYIRYSYQNKDEIEFLFIPSDVFEEDDVDQEHFLPSNNYHDTIIIVDGKEYRIGFDSVFLQLQNNRTSGWELWNICPNKEFKIGDEFDNDEFKVYINDILVFNNKK